MLNLTSVLETINNVKRNLFYDTSQDSFAQLVFKNLDTELLTIETGFFMSGHTLGRFPNSENEVPDNEEQRKLSISYVPDGVDMDAIVALTTSVSYGNENYRIKGYIRPRTGTVKYRLLLESTGEET